MIDTFTLLILYSGYIFASPEVILGSMHGDKMSVEYREQATGKRVLVVQEKTGMNGSKSVHKDVQVIDLNLKKGEDISLNYGFTCTTQGKGFVYGIVSRAVAKKTGSFSPVRGWLVDEKNLKLIAIDDPKKVACVWSPEGESKYPF